MEAFHALERVAKDVQDVVERLDVAQWNYYETDAAERGVHDRSLRDALHALIRPLADAAADYYYHLSERCGGSDRGTPPPVPETSG